MALNSYLGQRGFVGAATEATVGTGVAASTWLPLLSESVEVEQALIYAKLMQQLRDTSVEAPALGEAKITGKIDVPLYIDQGLILLAQSIGSDTYQSSSAAGTAVSIGASGSGLAAGSTAITVTTQTSTPIGANDYVQIQQASGAISVTNLSEVHKVTSVSGAGPYVITFSGSETLKNTYTTAGQISRIPSGTLVFTHSLNADQPNAGTYKTVSLEINRGGLEGATSSQRVTGVIASKMTITADTKAEVKCSYDVTGLAQATIAASTPVFGTTSPFSLPNVTASLFGSSDTSATKLEIEIDNMGKEYWTFSGSAFPQLAVPVGRKVTFKGTFIAQGMTYFTNYLAATEGAVALTFAQGSDSVVINLPNAAIKKLGRPLKADDLVMQDVEMGTRASGSPSINATVINANWLPLL